MFVTDIIKEANQFYPAYLKAHSNVGNRVLHFIGATLFFVFIIAFFYTWFIWYIPIAIFVGYLLPGIGHHFLQKNDSFRSTKPLICVICATKLYWHTLTFQIKKKMKTLVSSI